MTHLLALATCLALIIGVLVVDRPRGVGRRGRSPLGGRDPVPATGRAGGAGQLGGGRFSGGPARFARRARPLPRGDAGGAQWAGRRQLAPIVVAGHDPGRGRLVIGRELRGRGRAARLLAAEVGQSVVVVGPTQSGKTSALAVPAILRWGGPVLAASVKTDLLRDTLSWRRSLGQVSIFDPADATGLDADPWSPVDGAREWRGACRVAADLTEVTKSEATTGDGEFWYAMAAKLLAPLLHAAAVGNRSMDDVVRWVDTQDPSEVLELLDREGDGRALQAFRASLLREERQRSSVYTTAETVLQPFADGAAGGRAPDRAAPDRAAPDRAAPDGAPAGHHRHPEQRGISPASLLDGVNTLYVCAPAHDQRRLRGVFVALVKEVLQVAFARSVRQGSPLHPPLLVVLDEAANIAPLAELDSLAATCAGHGVQLVTVWQDLAQVSARYGTRAATVVNNHRAKLFLSGIADPGTLEHASRLVGEEELAVPSVTHDAAGGRSVTSAPWRRPLLPPDAVRCLAPGTGILLYGSLPPVRVGLEPWFAQGELRARVGTRSHDGR